MADENKTLRETRPPQRTTQAARKDQSNQEPEMPLITDYASI
ncbi:hypothetical protein AB1M95_06850 [Sulfitobacter sp. LCG007]